MKDSLAIIVSGSCMIHCLLTPLVIGLGTMGIAGHWLGAEWIHQVLLIPVIMLALLSLPASYRAHQQHWPMVMAMLGIAVMLIAFWLPESLEVWITVPGALLLILAHAWNRTLMMRATAICGEISDG